MTYTKKIMRTLSYICTCASLRASTGVTALVLGLVFVAGSAAIAPTSALAQCEAPLGPTLEKLREDLLYARFDKARKPIEEMANDDEISAACRIEALELQAILQISLGQNDAAQKTLRTLYYRDHGHELKDQSVGPKVKEAFDNARRANSRYVNVQMENVLAPSETLRQQPGVEVRVIKNPSAIHELRITYRDSDTNTWSDIPVKLDENNSAKVEIPPVNTSESYDIEFYVVARAPSNAVLGRMGSEKAPIKITVPSANACLDPGDPACRCELRPKSPGCPYCLDNPTDEACSSADDPCSTNPDSDECFCFMNPNAARCDDGGVLSSWWFWTIAGVLVVGGGVTAAVLLSGGDDDVEGSLGTITLKP